MLRVGNTGPEVKELQEFLIAQGYELPEFGADGDFGPETLAAVKAYQSDQGLEPDGIVGPKTQATIDASEDLVFAPNDPEPPGGEDPVLGEDEGVVTEESSETTQEAEQRPGEGGVGGEGEDEETMLTILEGDEMEFHFDPESGKWYVEYGLPDSDLSVVFEADPDQMDALFGENQRPVGHSTTTLAQLLAGNGTFAGNIAEMEGTGSFEDEVRRTKTLALDAGVLPEWATATGEVMDMVYIAQSEGWTTDQLIEGISTTGTFAARFPNIDALKAAGSLTTIEAIGGFLEYEAGVKASIEAIGGNAAQVTPEVVGGLMSAGHALSTVQTSVQKFDRMNQYAPAMEAFNSILLAQGVDPITELQDMFDFVSGNASSDVYEIWEASSMAEAASAAGLGDVFTAEDAMRHALRTEGSTGFDDATGMFQTAAQLLLRMRHQVDVGQFGIEQDDIIDMALGAPLSSGASVSDLQEKMNRAALQAQKNLQGRTQTFKELGTSKQQSLSGLRESS